MSVIYDEKLLDKLGMAMVPSGYSNTPDENNAGGQIGKLYSVLPLETQTDEFLNSSTLNGLSIPSSYDTTYPLYAQGTGGWVRIDFTQTITSGSRLRYILRNGDNTANVAVLDNNLSNTYANGSGSFFYYLKIDDGLQIRILSETNIGTLDSFTSTLTQNGDFQFSRGSDATRVNSQGYIESVQVIGDELISNGGFDTTRVDVNVVNGDFEQIGSELVQNKDFEQIGSELAPVEDYDTNFQIIPSSGTVAEENGVITAVGATAVGNQVALTARNITVGKFYKVSFSLSNVTGGNFKLSVGNQYTTAQTEDGDYVSYIEYTAGLDRFYFAFGDFTGTVSNVSVKEVGQNWTFGNGWSIEDDGGNLRAVQSGGSTSSVYQNILTVGKLYKASFEITSITSGQFKIGIGENYSELYDEEGTYTYTAVATSDGLARIRPHSSTTVGTVDNFTIKEVGQNWYFTDYPTFYSIIEENNNKKLRIATSGSSYFYSLGSEIQAGKQYKLTFNISNYSGTGALKFNGGGVDSGFIYVSNGDKEFYFRATANGNLVFRTGGTPFNGDLDNVVLEEIQGAESWNFNSIGWYIDDGTFNAKGGGNYTATFPVTTVQDKPYRLTIDSIENISGGTGLYAVTLGSNQVIINNNSSSVDLIIKGSTTGGSTLGLAPGSSSFNLDNISLKEITDDTDIPRLDYSDGCPTLLLEPERTNLLPYSKDFSSNWVSNGSTLVTDNVSGVISPDNSQSTSLIEKNSQSYGRVEYIKQIDTTGYYTFSVFAKKTNIDSWIKLRIDANGVGECKFNLSNGEIGTSGTLPYDYGLEVYKDDWYRFYIVQNITDTSSNEYFRIYVMDSESGEGNTNDAKAYLWGAQVETGSYPTSYIPTNGETNGVTRRADICNNAGDSTIFNDSEGVLFMEFSALTDDSVKKTISIHGANNYIQLGVKNGGSNKIFAAHAVGGNIQSNMQYDIQDVTENIKIAFRYKLNDFSLWYNGSMVGTPDNLGSVFSEGALLSMAFETIVSGVSYDSFYGKAKSILYFPEALSNAELEYITSSDIDVVLQNNKLKATMLGDTYEDGHVEDRLNELF